MKKITSVLTLVFALALQGCASEPITVLQTRDGKILQEKQFSVEKSNAAATVGGAALGGLLGNQVGGGRGKTLATIGGTIAGGAAGHNLSKQTETHYEYLVLMEDGERFMLETKTARKPIGARVVVETLSTGRERVFVLN